jgi:predicted Zn-dependent protease
MTISLPQPDGFDLCLDAVSRFRPGEVELYYRSTSLLEKHAEDGTIVGVVAGHFAGIGVRVVVNRRMGFSCTGDLSRSGVETAVQQALMAARYSEPSPASVLPAPSGKQSLSGSDGRAGGGTTADVGLAALTLADTAMQVRSITSSSARVGDRWTDVAIASSTGVVARRRAATRWCQTRAATDQSDGFSCWSGTDLSADVLARVAADAATKAVALSATPQGSVHGQFPVVLDSMVVSFLARWLEPIFFGPRGGLAIPGASRAVTVIDDGQLPGAPGSRAFDDEGMPCGRTTLIRGGEVSGVPQAAVGPRRDRLGPTGNAHRLGYFDPPRLRVTNLFFEPGSRSLAQMLHDLDGVYVQGVEESSATMDRRTRQLSLRVSGLQVHRGDPVSALVGARLTVRIDRLLADVEEVGGGDPIFRPSGVFFGGAPMRVASLSLTA